MVALYPGYLSLTAVRAGSEVEVYFAVDGRYMETDTGANPGGSPLFSLARVKPDVPAALAQHFRWLVYPHTGNRVEYFEAPGATGPLLELVANSSSGLQPAR